MVCISIWSQVKDSVRGAACLRRVPNVSWVIWSALEPDANRCLRWTACRGCCRLRRLPVQIHSEACTVICSRYWRKTNRRRVRIRRLRLLVRGAVERRPRRRPTTAAHPQRATVILVNIGVPATGPVWRSYRIRRKAAARFVLNVNPVRWLRVNFPLI